MPYRVATLSIFFSYIVNAQMITASVGEYPPYVSRAEEKANMASEIVVAAYKEVGYQVTLRWVPWRRAYEEVKDGKVDISYPWRKTDEREKVFFFSNILYQSEEVFYYQKDTEFDWYVLSDLKEYSIGGSLGYSHIELLTKAGLKVNTAKTDALNLTKLYKKRIDIFPLDPRVGNYIISSLPNDYKNTIIAHEKALFTSGNYVIVSNSDPKRGQHLIDKFNRGLDIIKQNGVLETILSRYE